MTNATAIFIDAERQQVTARPWSMAVVSAFVGGPIENAVVVAQDGPLRTALYVNELARVQAIQPPYGFTLSGGPGFDWPSFLGNAVLASSDEDGNMVSVPATLTPENVKRQLTWSTPANRGPIEAPPHTFWLRQLVNTARASGFRMPKHAKGSNYSADSVAAIFWHAVVPQLEVFVFLPEKQSFEIGPNKSETPPPLDLPFATCAFELGGGRCLITPEPGSGVGCLVVHELEPLKYLYFYLIVGGGAGALRYEVRFDHSHVHVDYMGELARYYLGRLRQEKDGCEAVAEALRVPGPNPKKRRFHEIRRIFHVRPRAMAAAAYPGQAPRAIDWSHRYEVRGHWMHFWADEAKSQLDAGRLGKNRQGEYVEFGRTWRRPHEKGPEDKPLIKKVRLVD